jgi:hypothetical protein
MPEAVLVSLSIRLTITRSPKGRSFMESPGFETRVKKTKAPVKDAAEICGVGVC